MPCLLSGYSHIETLPATAFDMITLPVAKSQAKYVSIGESLESLTDAEHMYVAHSIRSYQVLNGNKFDYQIGNAIFWQIGDKYFMPCCGAYTDAIHDPAQHIKDCLGTIRQKRYMNETQGHFYVTPIQYPQTILSTFNQPFSAIYRLYNITYLAAQLQTKICVCTACQYNNKRNEEVIDAVDTASDIAMRQTAGDEVLQKTTCTIRHKICDRPHAKKVYISGGVGNGSNNTKGKKNSKRKKNNKSNNGQRNGIGNQDQFAEFEQWCANRKKKMAPTHKREMAPTRKIWLFWRQ